MLNKVSSRVDLYNLNSILLKSLWVLDYMSTLQRDRFNASEIAKFLIENKGINTSRQAVRSALTKESKLTNQNKIGFKLMKAGVDFLDKTIHINSVILIESNKPFSAKNITLKDIFNKTSGVLRICDPYLDVNTLDALFKSVDKKTPIKILVSKINDKPRGIISRNLSDLRKEGFNIEVKLYTGSQLHDRYFFDDRSFWLSGNSINHLGGKESFIVQLGEDIRQTILSTFNRRWKIGLIIK